jgi:hypothetical protein
MITIPGKTDVNDLGFSSMAYNPGTDYIYR